LHQRRLLNGHGERARRAIAGAGPQVVITDLGVLKPAADSQELTLVARYENVSVDKIRQATGWPLAIADNIDVVATPTADELRVLRDLHKRTDIAHAGDALRSRKLRVIARASEVNSMNKSPDRRPAIRTELPGPKARASAWPRDARSGVTRRIRASTRL
jgi:hypothetical protein